MSEEITGWCVVLADKRTFYATTGHKDGSFAWHLAWIRSDVYGDVDPFSWRDHQIALGARCFPCMVVEGRMSDKVIATDINGNKAIIPREPIERAGLPIPGPVTRPDGSVIWVENFDPKFIATST